VRRGILIVDHGSREPGAHEQLEALADRVRARLPGRTVEVAHLELQEPSIAQGIAACAAAGVEELVVHPYFLVAGRHAARDVPQLVREAARRHPSLRVRVSEPLGLHEKLVDVLLERVEGA
jgi:sirohydrochlorin ferrochelatase